MKKYYRYLPLIFFTPYLWFSNFDSKPGTLNLMILFAVIILILAFFEILDRTRNTRSAKWISAKSSKANYSIKFALLFGFPLSLLLDLSLSGKAGVLAAVSFINLPVIILFGWIGINEWNQLYKMYLDKKYFD